MSESLEALLAQDLEASEKKIIERAQSHNYSDTPLKAEKNATMLDFVEMVAKVITRTEKEYDVTFLMDEGKRLALDPNEKVNNVFITYEVLERVPTKEIKPRERESFIDEVTFSQSESRQGRVYGQKFIAKIQFNIIASEYKAAERVMNIFEDLIFSYKHYFKKNGVAEILFEKQLTDKNYDIYRQNMSVRNLRYEVHLEKLHVIFDTEFDNVSIK